MDKPQKDLQETEIKLKPSTDWIKIERVANGFLVREAYEDEPGSYSEIVQVFEENEVEGKKEVMGRLLEYVADYFGLGYDKHSKQNLKISWNRKGHKVE